MNNNEYNYAKLPYGIKIENINNIKDTARLSPVIRFLMYKYSGKSLVEIMANFVDNLNESYNNYIEKRNYYGVERLANALGYKIRGGIRKNKNPYQRPFLGCQYKTSSEKIILLSTGITLEMARVTIVHEIMHSLFETMNQERPGNLSADDIEEALCDYGSARLLVPDDALDTLPEPYEKNFSKEMLNLASKLKVPRRYLAYRLYDILPKRKFINIKAIIEWQKNRLSGDYSNKNIIPIWSVCYNAYIPWRGSKNTCHAKGGGIIHKTISDDMPFVCNAEIEETKIGSLKGIYSTSVCSAGKKENNSRFAISVFADR